MKTSIATVSLSGNLKEKLEAIAAAHFDGVEIFENDFLTFDGSARDVARMTADLGLAITLYQPFRDFEGMPGELRTRAFDRVRRKFDLMRELGADAMLICSNTSPAALGGIDRAADDLAELGQIAAERNIRVGYEALAWGRFVNDHRDAWEIVRRADHPNVGLVLDSFHTLARKIPPSSIRSIPKDKILIVQLADAPALELDVLQWSRHLRNMPGQGDLPVTDFMLAVAATGYDGYLSLEIFNDQFRSGAPGFIALDGKRSLLALVDKVKRTQPGLYASVPELPPPTSVDGVEFIEFASGDEEAADLEKLLETLGFHRAARHRSKSVALYEQGDIRIVVNTEREGLAHSSYISHGTSAYAVGLKVPDARRTIARAQALDAQVFRQKPHEGEVELPAIRGIGGGLLYFFDGEGALAHIWETEFAREKTKAPRAHLTRVDHVAQTMSYDEMLTWILFYTSIFAVEKSPTVDIVDPGGLVRSRVIENKDGRFRLTLNGVESRRTFAGQFIERSFGSSIQHVAFEAADIFATADALEGAGFQPLSIGPNYYDDLQARFDLTDDFVAQLRARQILYDRDGGGEFFQMYSPVFRDGFFFEIVERRGGYAGYGAPNAIFRIASQRRLLSSDMPD
ncbi:MAG: TIM barrel protein [Pseudolabrys sp.]|jgi:4-hydroxyphenylpyruvate dioxygenase